MKRILCSLFMFFVLVSTASAVTVSWDRYEGTAIIVLEVYTSTDQENWTLIKDNIPITEVNYTVPDPDVTTTYALKAVNTETGEKSLLSDITEACIFRPAVQIDPPVVEPVDPPPPSDEPTPVPIETVDPTPEVLPIDSDVHTLGMIRLVNCANPLDSLEIKLCGEDNDHPYLLAESTEPVSEYYLTINTDIVSIVPYDDSSFFYNLMELPYGEYNITIGSDADSAEFVLFKQKSLDGLSVHYIMIPPDDDIQFVDPLDITIPLPEVVAPSENSGGCFIRTLFQ